MVAFNNAIEWWEPLLGLSQQYLLAGKLFLVKYNAFTHFDDGFIRFKWNSTSWYIFEDTAASILPISENCLSHLRFFCRYYLYGSATIFSELKPNRN